MRKVKIAYLHNTLHVPGIGELGKNINTTDTQYRFRNAQLTWDGAGLELTYNGRTVWVPATNVVYMEFEPAPPPSPSKAKYAA